MSYEALIHKAIKDGSVDKPDDVLKKVGKEYEIA